MTDATVIKRGAIKNHNASYRLLACLDTTDKRMQHVYNESLLHRQDLTDYHDQDHEDLCWLSCAELCMHNCPDSRTPEDHLEDVALKTMTNDNSRYGSALTSAG